MGRGAKLKDASKRRSEFVPARMTPRELEALQRLADEHCCSVSAVIRWAVHQHVMGERADIAMQNAIKNGAH